MTTSSDRSAAMADGRAVSQRRRQRVARALQTAADSGAEISISAIARIAGVDRSFFYRPQHRDLLSQVQAAASEPRDSVVGPTASRASLQADLANSQDRCKRLADHVSLLEKWLSEAIGEGVWSCSGLGSAIDVGGLRWQIITLEEANADLRLKMEDLEEEIAAARANNRELMTQFNAKGRAPS